MSGTPVLGMRNIAKAFGRFYALKRVDLTVWPDKIHVLIGENGAERSTLVEILAGTYTATSGEIPTDGRPFHIRGSKNILNAGIALIYQEMQPTLNPAIAKSIFSGSKLSHNGLVQHKEMVMQSQKVIDQLSTQFKASGRVMTSIIAGQQQAEIVRALHRNNRILAMNKSIAALFSRGTHHLFGLVIRLRGEEIAIICISHRMAKVYELSDRVSVLHNEQCAGSLTRGKLGTSEPIHTMVDRPLSDLLSREHDIPLGKTRLSIHHLTDDHEVRPCSLLVRPGGIVGLAGLVGTGHSRLAQLTFGARKVIGGMIEVDGEPVVIHSPHETIDHGIDFLIEDRKEQGLLLELAAAKNITMATLERDASWGMLDRKKAQTILDDAIRLLNICVPHTQVCAGRLSDGNQQKLLISYWAAIGPRILVLDESTRSVDIDARSKIYRIMDDTARKGVAVLIIPSGLPKVVGMSDRTYIMQEGSITDELNGQGITQESTMTPATDVSDSRYQAVPRR